MQSAVQQSAKSCNSESTILGHLVQYTQHDHRVHLCALSPSALVGGGTSVQLGNDHDDSDNKDYKDDMDDKDD